MLMNYLNIGISFLIVAVPIAILCVLFYYVINFLISKKSTFVPLKIVFEISWVAIIISILFITGVINPNYNLNSILELDIQFSFKIFEEGLTPATLLNLILFIPYGFLTAIVLKNTREKMIYGFLIGLLFSIGIEFTQCFTGRFVELEDLLMNTLGGYIGYLLSIFFIKYKNKRQIKCLNFI